MLVGVLAVVLLVALGIAMVLRGDDVYGSPQRVELPPLPQQPRATQMYLGSPDGQVLTAALDASAPLRAADSIEDCIAVAALLDAVARPADTFSAAAGVPDPATAEIAGRYLAALTRFVGECLDVEAVPDDDELTFTATVLERRLEALQ